MLAFPDRFDFSSTYSNPARGRLIHQRVENEPRAAPPARSSPSVRLVQFGPVAFRNWFLDQFVRQIDGQEPTPWQEPERRPDRAELN